uniref:Putative secreted glycine-rich cement protein n=1 Tax=Amblyomma triste TaxID=251400 RepID=A0A023GN16_AMBTT
MKIFILLALYSTASLAYAGPRPARPTQGLKTDASPSVTSSSSGIGLLGGGTHSEPNLISSSGGLTSVLGGLGSSFGSSFEPGSTGTSGDAVSTTGHAFGSYPGNTFSSNALFGSGNFGLHGGAGNGFGVLAGGPGLDGSRLGPGSSSSSGAFSTSGPSYDFTYGLGRQPGFANFGGHKYGSAEGSFGVPVFPAGTRFHGPASQGFNSGFGYNDGSYGGGYGGAYGPSMGQLGGYFGAIYPSYGSSYAGYGGPYGFYDGFGSPGFAGSFSYNYGVPRGWSFHGPASTSGNYKFESGTSHASSAGISPFNKASSPVSPAPGLSSTKPSSFTAASASTSGSQ